MLNMEKNSLKSASEKTKQMVRFPNESIPFEIELDMDEFHLEKDFGDELFGYWRGVYISIKK
jgi:hypothetical protein